VIQIKLCPECWTLLEPYLHRATLSERSLLQQIASLLTRCPRCKVQGTKLSAAARKLTIDVLWDND
jgi:hypothetical protein